jgi:hypothetical protein
MHSCFKTCDGVASLLAVRLIHRPMVLLVTIILLGVAAHPQSVPNDPVSANDLVRRVINNELAFQDDHTNWMYRLEKEQYGKKQVEEIADDQSKCATKIAASSGC